MKLGRNVDDGLVVVTEGLTAQDWVVFAGAARVRRDDRPAAKGHRAGFAATAASLSGWDVQGLPPPPIDFRPQFFPLRRREGRQRFVGHFAVDLLGLVEVLRFDLSQGASLVAR